MPTLFLDAAVAKMLDHCFKPPAGTEIMIPYDQEKTVLTQSLSPGLTQRGRVMHFNVNQHRTCERAAAEIVQASPWDTAPR